MNLTSHQHDSPVTGEGEDEAVRPSSRAQVWTKGEINQRGWNARVSVRVGGHSSCPPQTAWLLRCPQKLNETSYILEGTMKAVEELILMMVHNHRDYKTRHNFIFLFYFFYDVIIPYFVFFRVTVHFLEWRLRFSGVH